MSYTGCMDEKLRRHGRGTYAYRNAFFKYTGEWSQGIKEGRGALEMRDGSVIEAEFRDGEITGEGVRRWPSGKIYEGDFEEGEFHGQGRMALPSGEQYVGDFARNRRHGNGELTLADGTIFQGRFDMHKKHGEGTEYHFSGNVFTGSWEAGLRAGPGKLAYAGGEVLEGTWRGGALDPGSKVTFEDPGCGFAYDGGWAVVADGGVVPTAAAVGNIAVQGTSIEAPDPDETAAAAPENADPNTPNTSAMPPVHSWVANLGAGDRIEDWSFTATPEDASVALAEKGRLLNFTTWLLRAEPSVDGDNAPSEASQGGAGAVEEGEELPRAVDLLRPVPVEGGYGAGDGAEEVSNGAAGGGGSALLVEPGVIVTLPVREDGTVSLPGMVVVEGAAAGVYEMRVRDVTSFGPGSVDVGFQRLPELRIRISIGVGGGGGSKGKKKGKKKR